MQQTTQVEIKKINDIAVLVVSGEVTSFSEKILEESYQEVSSEGFKKICFNFENVSYINSAGMAIIIGILTKSRKLNQSLSGCGLTEHFQKIFDMVGITKYMPHWQSEEEALRAF